MMRGFFKFMAWVLIASIAITGLAGAGLYLYFSRDLPQISSLKDYRPAVVTCFYSDDGRKIAELYKERRIVIPLSQMPKHLINAFIAAEDARFYEHEGIDFHSIIRAFFKNLEAGAIVQGGSTITQQVAKSFFLSPERSYKRKIKEAILAYRIDKNFSKDEILYLYLNQIYLGNGAYGVEAAAENYFGKKAKELTLAESAILAGLPRAPSRYSPKTHPERARQRQIYVLKRMEQEGFITRDQVKEALSQEIKLRGKKNWFLETVPYYSEYVRRKLEKIYGEHLLTDGFKVYTCVNIEMQEAARKAIERGLRALDKRQGFRGPITHLEQNKIEAFCKTQSEMIKPEAIIPGAILKGVVLTTDDEKGVTFVRFGNHSGIIPVSDMRWARRPDPKVPYNPRKIYVHKPSEILSPGDVIWVRLKKQDEKTGEWKLSLEQEPIVQSALLSIETQTGWVKAMVGGRDYKKSAFNRAVQSRRQPGSAFKPIIYAAALDKGYTPATLIPDTPVVLEDKERDFTWKPDNYDKKFHGFTLFRDGLIYSRNVITIKILRDIGVGYVIDYARRLGIRSPLSPDLSLALGSSGLSLLEVVGAYSVFANQGYRIEPVFVSRIEDRDGNIIFENNPKMKKVIDKSTAYIITHLLEEVVQEGTGRRVRALKRPAAGKTGTTNNLHDAWFVGYTPRYVTGAWVGFDQERTLGAKETGSRAASPIWLYFMQEVLKDKPVRVFPVPDNVVFAKIDADTGLLPGPDSRRVIFECFKQGTAPKKKTPPAGSPADTEEFLKKGLF